MQEQFDYVDGNVTNFVKDQLVSNIEFIVDELRDGDFHDEEIYDYLNKVVMTVMNGNTYNKIQQLLDNEKNNK